MPKTTKKRKSGSSGVSRCYYPYWIKIPEAMRKKDEMKRRQEFFDERKGGPISTDQCVERSRGKGQLCTRCHKFGQAENKAQNVLTPEELEESNKLIEIHENKRPATNKIAKNGRERFMAKPENAHKEAQYRGASNGKIKAARAKAKKADKEGDSDDLRETIHDSDTEPNTESQWQCL